MANEPAEFVSEFTAAIILPAQYFPTVGERRGVEGEYRLLVAVLEDAVRSYLVDVNPRNRLQRLRFAEIRYWFFARRRAGAGGLFAFESVCELLDVDPESLRRRLQSLTVRDMPRRRQRLQDSRVSRRIAVRSAFKV